MDRKQNQKVFNKLIDAGCLTEKDIERLSIWDILQIRDITKAEMETVALMQKAIKEKRLVSFLAGRKSDETMNEVDDEVPVGNRDSQER